MHEGALGKRGGGQCRNPPIDTFNFRRVYFLNLYCISEHIAIIPLWIYSGIFLYCLLHDCLSFSLPLSEKKHSFKLIVQRSKGDDYIHYKFVKELYLICFPLQNSLAFLLQAVFIHP